MGKRIYLEDGCSVEMLGDPQKLVENGGAFLGQGGQGSVYKVRHTQRGQDMVLKIYSGKMSREFIDNIRKNIAKGAPNDSFLWPQGLTEPLGVNKNRRGYIMDLYDSNKYSSLPKLLKNMVSFPSKEMQIAALIDLVDAFELLHAKGYSYQDLNDGGVLIDCQNGKVLICDNDNVAPSGINIPMDDQGHYIQGKFKYMAPEVAINMFKPDKHSDRFSLAVLMFMILTYAHPYDGIKRLSGPLTPALQEKVYGIEPVFIFHPTDKSNRPDSKEDVNAIQVWPTIPDFIQNLFIKTFTAGMPSVGKRRDELEIERQGRTSEKEWREALHRWMDTMADCPNCNYAVCTPIQGNTLLDTKCPHCGKKVQVVRPILIIKKNGRVERTIVLETDKTIAKCSVTNEISNAPAFVVKRSTKMPDVFGIQNLLPYQWKCSQAGSNGRLVGPNEILVALNGVHIEFDYTYSGEIVYSKY